MANAYKVVGQANPGTTLTALYTVGATKEFSGTLFVANNSASAQTARVRVAIGGAADSAGQALLPDFSIPANDLLPIPGFSLAATDVVRVYGSTTDVVFTLMGVEISS